MLPTRMYRNACGVPSVVSVIFIGPHHRRPYVCSRFHVGHSPTLDCRETAEPDLVVMAASGISHSMRTVCVCRALSALSAKNMGWELSPLRTR